MSQSENCNFRLYAHNSISLELDIKEHVNKAENHRVTRAPRGHFEQIKEERALLSFGMNHEPQVEWFCGGCDWKSEGRKKWCPECRKMLSFRCQSSKKEGMVVLLL